MQMAGPGQTGEAVRSAVPEIPETPRTPPRVPSWGRVLATTIGLWTARRVPRLHHPRLHHPRLRRPRLALFLAACMLAATAAGVAVAVVTGGAHGAREAHRPQGAQGARDAGAAVRALAAAWVAGQVGSGQSIACDPLMCAALGAHGVASGRLMPLGPAASAPQAGQAQAGQPQAGQRGAAVVVASSAAYPRLGQDAPVLLAGFGDGASRIEVRVAAPGGAAAYAAALRADLAARRSGGTQLLHSRSIQASAQAAGQLEAGQVDSRLLIMLAMLASQHPWRVVAFGDASPGMPLTAAPFRQVVIAGVDDRAVSAALALVHAQRAPWSPARAAVVRLAGGQPGLRIDFAAPGPLGLLTGTASG